MANSIQDDQDTLNPQGNSSPENTQNPASPESLANIPVASQEGINHFRSQHTGAAGGTPYNTPVTNPLSRQLGGSSAAMRPQNLRSRENNTNTKAPSSQVAEAAKAGVRPSWQTTNTSSGYAKFGRNNDQNRSNSSNILPTSALQRITGRLNKKKTTVGVTAGVVIFGGVAGFSFLQGPLKILHFGKIASLSHLSMRENETNSR